MTWNFPCSSGWPRTHRHWLASASWMLGLGGETPRSAWPWEGNFEVKLMETMNHKDLALKMFCRCYFYCVYLFLCVCLTWHTGRFSPSSVWDLGSDLQAWRQVRSSSSPSSRPYIWILILTNYICDHRLVKPEVSISRDKEMIPTKYIFSDWLSHSTLHLTHSLSLAFHP